jgi:putative salt-induced outer membrane protein YdiY
VTNTLIVETGSSDTMSTDSLSLRVKIDDTLSLAVGVQMTNNTNPPPGNVKHTDTVMTVNLVYENKSPTVSLKSPIPEAVTDLDLP